MTVTSEVPRNLAQGQDYSYVTSDMALRAALKILWGSPEIGIDTETTFPRDPERKKFSNTVYNQLKGEPAAFDPHTSEVRLVQMQGRKTVPFVIDLWALKPHALTELSKFLKSYKGVFIGHNIKFDLKMIFGTLGVWLDETATIFCTRQASKLLANSVGLNERGHRLVDVARDFLEVELDKTEQSSDWSRVNLSEEQLEYAAWDTIHLHALYDILKGGLIGLGQTEPMTLEMAVIGPTARMEYAGLPMDLATYHKVQEAARYAMPALLQQIGKYFKDEIGQTLAMTYIEIEAPSGETEQKPYMLPWGGGKAGKDFLMSKSNLVLDMLQQLGLEIEDDNGSKSLDNVQKATLEAFRESHPGVGHLIDYWNLVKQAQFDYEKYLHPKTCRIHANFNISGASTGRFSSSEPNLQQVPGKFFMKHPDGSRQNYRFCFHAAAGWLMCSADFSGQELCVMAALSGDALMIDILKRGGDLHSEAAAGMFNIPVSQAKDKKPGDPSGRTYRDYGKIVMFSLAYGKSAKGFAKDWKIPEKEAEKIINNFEARFPQLAAWLKHQGELGAMQNWSRLPNGAMRFVGGGIGAGAQNAARRQSANYQVQGISSWMTRIAMITLDKQIREDELDMELVACVHDELLCVFKTDPECLYGVFCRDEDEIGLALVQDMADAKKNKDKDAEKAAEKGLEKRREDLNEACRKSCCATHCATRYEDIIDKHMKAAGNQILAGIVPAAASVVSRKHWSH